MTLVYAPKILYRSLKNSEIQASSKTKCLELCSCHFDKKITHSPLCSYRETLHKPEITSEMLEVQQLFAETRARDISLIRWLHKP